MSRSWWRTGPPIKHQQPIPRLSGGQLLRQLIALALILLIWGGGFYVLLGASGSTGAALVAEAPPTATPSPAPTDTATPTVTRTPAPIATTAIAATAKPTAIKLPTSTPTATPSGETPTAAPAAGGGSPARFKNEVQPILKQVCGKCHGGDKEEEGLNLLSYARVMQGSDNGPVITPGDAANSLLVQQVESGDMPKRGPKLLPKQIRAIVNWINTGAPNN